MSYILSSLLLFLPALSFAIPLTSGNGKTEFLAVGKPSAIKIKGEGKGPEGQFDLKKSGAGYALTAEITFDLDTLDTGISLRDRHMKEKYLETSKFKSATVKIKDAPVAAEAAAGNGDFKVPGTLTLKGVEKPVEISLKLETSGEQVKCLSSFKVALTEFPLEIPKYAGITVANEVEVKVETAFPKKELTTIK